MKTALIIGCLVASLSSMALAAPNTVPGNGVPDILDDHEIRISLLEEGLGDWLDLDWDNITSEITINSNNIIELYDITNDISVEIDSITGDIVNIQGDINSLTSSVTTNTENISTLFDTTNNLQIQVDHNTGEIISIQGDLEVISNNVQYNSESIEILQGEVSLNTEMLVIHDGRITNLEEVTDYHSSVLENHTQQFNDLNSYLQVQNEVYSQNFERIEERFNDMDRRLIGVEREVRELRGGIAAAIAMANHQYDVNYRDPQVSVAVGNYQDANALSIGMGFPVNDRTFFNISASTGDRGATAIGAGILFKF